MFHCAREKTGSELVVPDSDQPITQRIADVVRFGHLSLGGLRVGSEGEVDELSRRGRDEADPPSDQLARLGLLGFGHAAPLSGAVGLTHTYKRRASNLVHSRPGFET